MEITGGHLYKARYLRAPSRKEENGLVLVLKSGASGLYAVLFVSNKSEGLDIGGGLFVSPQAQAELAQEAFLEDAGAIAPAALEAVLRARAICAAQDCLAARGPAQVRMSASGKNIGSAELSAMLEASLDMWLTAGRFHAQFEAKLSSFFGAKGALAVNSGSSANLLAVAALCSHRLGARRLRAGDEVITAAAAFPTTVAPLVQHGVVPVFADIEPGTCNIKISQLEKCLSKQTKAVFLAHTLGNPFDAHAVAAFCKKHSLWLVEDNCDSLGSKLDGRLTGTFGHLATLSFYPAHHITTGEGGALIVNDAELLDAALSLRDWGRDCKCPPGQDGVCGQRFSKKLGRLPAGYDHKYTYSHLGYNLKMTDWQAALGLVQLDRLAVFTARRKRNFEQLNRSLGAYGQHLVLPVALPEADPAWFGYPLTVRAGAPFTREDLTGYLEENGIGTRTLFGGNLLRQPAFTEDEIKLRILDSGPLLSNRMDDGHYALLPGTEAAMNGTFWIGLWAGLDDKHMGAMAGVFREFFRSRGA